MEKRLSTWNSLIAATENCQGCRVWEDGPPTGPEIFHAETTLLHELGHCPLGLDHPNRNWDAQLPPDGIWEPTSFTRSVDVAPPPDGINVGSDFIRGTLDDIQLGAGSMPNNVHWFRVADNDPAVVDSTAVDILTYSPSVALNLPDGHSWAANANLRTTDALGFENTQNVMYGLRSPLEKKVSLTADDVAMVKMGMTGQGLLVGTADDYTVELELTGVCSGSEDVLITFGDANGAIAFCEVKIDFSFPQNPLLARHMSLQPGADKFVIFLEQNLTWDFGIDIFASDFENGNLNEWADVVTPD